jgi:hypothetical protein
MSVEHVWAGAVTDTSFWVRGKVTGSSTRLAVDTDPAFPAPVFFGPDTPTADGIVSLTATGLDPDTRYHYALEDDSVLDTAAAGTVRTHPGPVGERASYVFGVAGDAGLTGAGDDSHITDEVSNNPVFDTMAAQSLAEDWAWFSHLGDLHYRNIATADASLYRTAYDDNLTFNGTLGTNARQGLFLRAQALTYVWDDHDFGPNNSDSTAAGNADANAVYRERLPHYPLPGGTSGIYQAWQAGRVLHVVIDCRTFRDPNSDPQAPSKTMLGTSQKAWLEALLTTARDSSGAQALVLQSSSRWIGGTDTWSSFLHERDEIVQLLGDTGWLDRMIMLTADEHALGISSGPNNPHGAFPMFMLASMDSSFSTGTDDNSPIYNLARKGGRQQYGTLRVTDNGHTIALTGTGYRNGTVLMQHTAYVHTGNPVWSLNGTTDNKGDIVSPFRPVLDDQGVRNQITATREDGGEHTYTDTAHAATRGTRSAGVTVNVATDEQLPSQASWRVRLGTEPGMRYPAVSPALNVRPELVPQWLATELGDAGRVTGLPPQHPADTVALIAEGYTQTIQPHRWDVTLNTSPAAPYTVAQMPAGQDLSLADGTFETGAADWVGSNSTIVQSDEEAYRGTYSGKMTVTGTPAQAFVRPVTGKQVPVTPGVSYRLTLWAYSPAGYSSLIPAIDWRDASSAFISTSAPAAAAIAAGVWTPYTAVGIAPAGAAFAVYGPTLSANPPTGTVLHVDEAQLGEATVTGQSAGPARPNRWDTSGSELVTAVDADDTELIVHTPPDDVFSRVPWIISDGLADAPNLRPTHFPFDLRLGGEVVRATACEPAVWDAFGRTVASGWGTADSGQTWALTGSAADFAVGSGYGSVTQPTTGIAHLTAITAPSADVDLYVDVATDQLAAGASLFAGPTVRMNTNANFYMARVDFTTSAGIAVTLRKRVANVESQLAPYTSPLTHVAGTFYRVRLQVIGSSLRAKIWNATTREPETWHLQATDTALTAAATVGTRSFANTGSTAVNPQIRFDNFNLVTPQRITATRSINTVTKPHAAGTAVSLDQPAPLAL